MEELYDRFCDMIVMGYRTRLHGECKCTQECKLGCNCTKGEIMNYALDIMCKTGEKDKYSDYKTKIISLDCGLGLQVVRKSDNLPYVGIRVDDECICKTKNVKHSVCMHGDDNKLYINNKPKKIEDIDVKDMRLYRIRQASLEQDLGPQNRSYTTLTRPNKELMLEIIRRIRLYNDLEKVHRVLMILNMFMFPQETINLMKQFVGEKNRLSEDVEKTFKLLRLYADILYRLFKYSKEKNLTIITFVCTINELCGIDLSNFYAVYCDNNVQKFKLQFRLISDNFQKSIRCYKDIVRLLESIKQSNWFSMDKEQEYQKLIDDYRNIRYKD